MPGALILFVALILPGHGAVAAACGNQSCFAAKVVGVSDGDTVTLLMQGDAGPSQVRTRLTEIDAPERRQPWGARSRQALANKLFGQQVLVASSGKDRYGRLLARLRIGNRDINREMVRDGHAWVYRRYATENWLPDETAARNAGRGLWSLHGSQRMPPWEWRQRQRQAKAAQRSTPARSQRSTTARSPAVLSCGAKRYCAEMTSCAEARFHLRTCALTSLDGDGDGVPCERRLCRG